MRTEGVLGDYFCSFIDNDINVDKKVKKYTTKKK